MVKNNRHGFHRHGLRVSRMPRRIMGGRMRSHKRLFLIIFLALAVGVIGMEVGLAVDCSFSLVNGCTVPSSFTFPKNTYYWNGTSVGAITINGENLMLNGNGSTLIGNFTPNFEAINIFGGNKTNITVTNFSLINYQVAMLTDGNNTLLNISNINFTNNWEALRLIGTKRSYIYNNWFFNNTRNSSTSSAQLTVASFSASLDDSNENTNIFNNRFIDGYDCLVLGIDAKNYSNNIFDNTFDSCQNYAIQINNFAYNYSVYGNNITNTGWDGIQIRGGLNNISYNFVNNSGHHGIDFYTLTFPQRNIVEHNRIGKTFNSSISNPYSHYIYLYRAEGNLIRHNIATEGTAGQGSCIVLQGTSANPSKHNVIANNSFLACNETAVTISSSVNNSFINNSFSFRTFNYVFEIGDAYNTSIESSLFNLQTSGEFEGSVNGTLNNLFINNTNRTATYNLKVGYVSNSLMFFSNGSVACSNINSCDGNINITLAPGNYSYILDNFNVTESIARQNSPIWFSSSTSTEKHIASNLTQSINATVIFDVSSCDNLARIDYTSDTGTYTQAFPGTGYTCANNVVTININNIEPAQNSNIIRLTYNYDRQELEGMCSNLVDGFGEFGQLLTLIIIGIVIVLVVGGLQMNGPQFDFKGFLIQSSLSLVFVVIIAILGPIMIQFIC